MKLLLDEKISHRIIQRISSRFPEVLHARDIGLPEITDMAVWEFAQKNDCVIITFDAAFNDLSNIKGFPPKVVWLRIGNTSTLNQARVLIDNAQVIEDFLIDPELGCLEIRG